MSTLNPCRHYLILAESCDLRGGSNWSRRVFVFEVKLSALRITSPGLCVSRFSRLALPPVAMGIVFDYGCVYVTIERLVASLCLRGSE